MKKVAIFRGERISQGAINLRDNLRRRGVEWCNILRSEGTAFRGGEEAILINWGTATTETRRLQTLCDTFNKAESIVKATNKLRCLRELHAADVPTIPWYDRFSSARDHINDAGGRIYARTVLNGHSGEGIVVILSANDPQLRRNPLLVEEGRIQVRTVGQAENDRNIAGAALFTIGHVGRRTEYRVHVFNGKAILFQKKVRRQEEVDANDGNSLVRNIHTGWVYSVNQEILEPTKDRIGKVAIYGCKALGLDFGAVDLIWPEGSEQPMILEINTAPGLEGETTLNAYCDAIIEVANQ